MPGPSKYPPQKSLQVLKVWGKTPLLGGLTILKNDGLRQWEG